MILGRRVCAEAERHDGMFRVTLIDKEDLKKMVRKRIGKQGQVVKVIVGHVKHLGF